MRTNGPAGSEPARTEPTTGRGAPPTPAERVRRRDTFAGCADAYADVRPGYPDEMWDAAIATTTLTPGDRLLDVGCGAGQASVALAARGFRVLAIDRSAAMLEVGRRRHASVEGVEWRHADVEALSPPALGAPFRGVVFATSYHWLDPHDRVARCAALLEGRGALLLVWHTHPPPFTGFFERVQPIYERWVPAWSPPPSPGMAEDRVRGVRDELARSRAFDEPERLTFDWSRRYGRDDYLRLLTTYSDHALLEPEVREGLLGEVAELIDGDFDGWVERPYRTEAIVARRRPERV